MNNEKLLLYNSYLNIEEYLQKHQFYIKDNKTPKKIKNNLTQFINDFYKIKDPKLQEYYDVPITDTFIDTNIYFIFPPNDISNNPKQVNGIIEYMINVKKQENKEKFQEIILDFITTRIYDCLCSHKPHQKDILLFNYLIETNLKNEIDEKSEIDQQIFLDLIKSIKYFEKLKGLHQKISSYHNLFKIFGNYSTFKKGKFEGAAADDNLTNIKDIISRCFPKTLIINCKYIYLFENGYNEMNSFTSSLIILLNDIK